MDGTDRPHRDIRIANTLVDENGDDVGLKKGAHVEVTVSAGPGDTTAPKNVRSAPIRG